MKGSLVFEWPKLDSSKEYRKEELDCIHVAQDKAL
jgi:hypothetical protein